MTTGYTLTPEAVNDIAEITAYIADDNLDAALRLRDDLFDAFKQLSLHPGMGHRRRDLTPMAVRFWTVRGRYMIVYRGETAKLPIEVRVISGYRDIAAILGV